MLASDNLCGNVSFLIDNMKTEHTDAIDLNLLMLFHQVWTHRSVSAAAEHMGLTQSAVSHSLARLRRLFDDQLFVRAGGAMVPTPRAAALAIPIHEVIDKLQRDILPRTRFDAATAQRSFSIALSDLGEIVTMPVLLQHLALKAAGCRLHSIRLPNSEIEDALESGHIELAVGNVFEPRRNCFQQTLYTHDYRVIAWDRHPRLGQQLSLAQYRQERHLVAQTGSDEHLRRHGLLPGGVQREEVASVGGLLSLPWLLPETELLATVPSHLAKVACGRFPLQQFALPLDVPPYAIKTYWHARLHSDDGHRWLRETTYELMRHYPQWEWEAEGPQPPQGPRASRRRPTHIDR